MKEFNGFRSWNAWNVSLWINNDEGLYNMAREYYTDERRKHPDNDDKARRYAARQFVRDMAGCKTPDGGVYNRLAVYLAMEEMLD